MRSVKAAVLGIGRKKLILGVVIVAVAISELMDLTGGGSDHAKTAAPPTTLGVDSPASVQKICGLDEINVYREHLLAQNYPSDWRHSVYLGSIQTLYQDAKVVGGQWASAVPSNEFLPTGGPVDQVAIAALQELCGQRILRGAQAPTTAPTPACAPGVPNSPSVGSSAYSDLTGTWDSSAGPFTFCPIRGSNTSLTTQYGGSAVPGTHEADFSGVNAGGGSLIVTYDFRSAPDKITINDGSSTYTATRA